MLVDWGPAIAVYLLVWIGSSLPGSSMPDHRLFEFDKVLHLVEYTVVGLSLAWGLRHRLAKGWKSFAGALLLIGLCWAISDETHQAFVGRDASLLDLLADLAGLLTAILLALGAPLRPLLLRHARRTGHSSAQA